MRIVHLEDDPLDTELVQAKLAEGGISCEITRVETREQFVGALGDGGFDRMLSDHSLPSFDDLSALKLAKVMCPEVPFILILGAIEEERAIEALKSGATDYVLKQRLERLVPAVRRAVREGEQQIQRRRTEEARTDETGEPFEVEYRVIAGDGQIVWLRDQATLVRDGDGRALYWGWVSSTILPTRSRSRKPCVRSGKPGAAG